MNSQRRAGFSGPHPSREVLPMLVSRLYRSLLAGLVAGAAFAGAAHAQTFDPYGGVPSQMPLGSQAASAAGHHGLRSLDLDGDHMLSRGEIQSRKHLARQFDAIDTNRDGELSRDELRAWRSAHPKGEGAARHAATGG